MTDSESPDVFRSKSQRGAGVRRMNRRPLMLVFGVFIAVASVVMYTVVQKQDQQQAKSAAERPKADPATAVGVLDDAPHAGLIAPVEPPAVPTDAVATAPRRSARRSESNQPAAPSPQHAAPGDSSAWTAEWQQYRQQQQQVAQAHMQAALAALSATPNVGDFQDRGTGSDRPRSVAEMLAAAAGGGPNIDGQMDRLMQLASSATAGMGMAGSIDENNAKGKADWLNSPADPADYLPTGRKPLVSPYEIKTGTIIPGVMIGGINSDLPGQIIGQVRENVWDTATGDHLLIPLGSRLVGTYDNQVTRGQSRVLVAWTRIIYPDGSSLDLGGMPGSDQAGYAGMKDKVNNHYWRVFGDAMMLSLFSAGIQLSQPEVDATNGNATYTNQQIIAASIGQQLGQAGMQIVQKNMNIQPTLEIRPGYLFNVMVTKDIIVSPWKG